MASSDESANPGNPKFESDQNIEPESESTFKEAFFILNGNNLIQFLVSLLVYFCVQ